VRRWRLLDHATGLAGESTIFAVSSGISTLATAVATAILARNLSGSEFGDFSFAISFFLFVGIFFEFGLFLPAARMAAAGGAKVRHSIVGAAFIAFVPIAVAFLLVVLVLSFWVDGVFNVSAAAAVRWGAPLAIVFPFQPIALRLAQGVERLHVYSVAFAAGQVAFVMTVGVIVATGGQLSATTSAVIRSGAALLGMAWLAVWLRPSFAGAFHHVREFVRQARSYGFQIYVGNVLGIGTYNMDVLMVAAWTNSRQVGLYALAVAMSSVIGLPVIGLSSALFPRLVGQPRLEHRWIVLTFAIEALGAVALVLSAGYLVQLFFSARYNDAVRLVLPLALAQVVRGVTTTYNTFLSANAHGRQLRNAAIVLMVSNVALNFALIPQYGAWGAAWASLGALILNLGAHVWYYRQSLGGVPPGQTAPRGASASG
jgi:O-antigen/teichoic acid export membrane protein